MANEKQDEPASTQPVLDQAIRAMAEQAKALAASVQELGKDVAVNRNLIQEVARLIEGLAKANRPTVMLLVALLAVGVVGVLLLLLQLLRGSGSSPPTAWLGLPMLFTLAAGATAVVSGLKRGSGDWLTKVAGWATILGFGVSLAMLVTDQYRFWKDDVKTPDLTLGFVLPNNPGVAAMPSVLVGPFVSSYHDSIEPRKAPESCKPTVIEAESLEQQVCATRRQLAGAEIVIVIGRHDRQPLSRSAERRVLSNESLAQLRADEVSRLLRDARICATSEPPVGRVVTASSAARIVGTSDTACDRMVEVVAFPKAAR